MIITGYSERGAVNALFYELAYSPASLKHLEGLLDLAYFASGQKIPKGIITDAHVFIEQSLSDFGDADAILLLKVGDKRLVVFLEAKVKSSASEEWTLERQFGQFVDGCRTNRKLSSSNLFTQLYHKACLIKGLSDGGIKKLEEGLPFPACSTKVRRKIGQNPVVHKVVREIEQYARDPWYIALVPDTTMNVCDFFDGLATRPWPLRKPLDIDRWGGLAWEAVRAFCDSAMLPNTLQVLDFNDHQICAR